MNSLFQAVLHFAPEVSAFLQRRLSHLHCTHQLKSLGLLVGKLAALDECNQPKSLLR